MNGKCVTKEPTIWAITDGRAGNVAQAMGLAEAIARTIPVVVSEKQINLRKWAAQIPPALAWRIRIRERGWPFSGIATGSDQLQPPWPDLVIGAGRRVAVITAALRRVHGVKAVQLLDPQMPARDFDAVIVPRHDALTGENVLTTTGALNRLDPQGIALAGEAWRQTFAGLPHPRIAVLLGGPSRSNKFGAEDETRIAAALQALSRSHGLMVTPSRRTPPDLTLRLQNLGQNAWIWTGKGANPYPGLLAHADAVLVTEDSVNMASEAATTGLAVHVVPVTGTAPKISRFHQALQDQGISRRFEGSIAAWTYPPLSEADRIAAELIRRGIVTAS